MRRPKYLKCCVPGCPSKEGQPSCPKFHYVPVENIKRRKIWLTLINPRSTDIRKKRMFICEKHFERVFITKENKLTRFAYPTLFTKEEIQEGKSKKFPISDLLGLIADHPYCQKPPIVAEHSYQINVPFENNLQQTFENNVTAESEKDDLLGLAVDHLNYQKSPSAADNSYLPNISAQETLENNVTADTEKEHGENNSENKQNITEKDEVDNNMEEKEDKSKKKGNKKPPLGSAKRPIYFIHSNNKDQISYDDNPNVVILKNSEVYNNPTDNDINLSLTNNPDGNTSSKLHKLLVNNNIINDDENVNNVIDDGAVDDDNDHVFDPKMVIDLTEDPLNNLSKNVPADDNPIDNNEQTYDYLAVDHTEVIGDNVENNLTNKEVLEKVMTEINQIKSSLRDTKLTEKLNMNDMALINYNNTVVLCRKSEVPEFKQNYLDKKDQDGETYEVKLNKSNKKHKVYSRIRRKFKLKKKVTNTKQNDDSVDQEAVEHKLCNCDENTLCEHSNPVAKDHTVCDDNEDEHPVDHDATTDSPIKAAKIKKRVNLRRYVTVEKFEEVNNDIQKLMQTTQQIQGQINTLTTVLTSLVTAVGKIEKEREAMLIKKFKKASKPKPPIKPRPKQPKMSKTAEAVSMMQNLLEQQGLSVEETILEQENLPDHTERENLQEIETLPERETLHLNEYLPEHKVLPLSNDSFKVNKSFLGKRHLPVQKTLPVEENLPEDEYIPEHRHLPVNNEYIPVYGRLPKKRRTDVLETLPVHGTLSTQEYVPENQHLPEEGTSLVNKYLPENRHSHGGKWLPVQETLPINDNLPGNRRLRGGKRLPILYQEEISPGNKHSRGGKWLPVQETLLVDSNVPGSRRLRGGKRLPVQETLPQDYLPVNRSLPMI